jgi:hypothetical protein
VTNPFGFYNSTNPSPETKWNANYSTFLTHITWANAMNGTLMSQATFNSNYSTNDGPYRNMTNDSYYLKTNPYGYYNSSTLPPAGAESDPLWTGNQTNYFNKTNILGFSYFNSSNFPYTHLSNFTDNLGNRGYTNLLNFTNGPGYYNVTTAPIYLNDTFRGSNYSAFLTHITWANAVNGTLMSQATFNTNYTANDAAYRSITNTSYVAKVGDTMTGSLNVSNANISINQDKKICLEQTCAKYISYNGTNVVIQG